MKTLVIIPCYNEEENIVTVISNLKNTVKDVDYLIVNDCSTDKSAYICKENNFNYIDLPINLGIGGSVQSGYIYACENNYDITVQMDGDGQHDPNYLLNVIEPIKNGVFDMCIGSRFIKKEGFQTSFMRRMGINLLSFILKILSGVKIYDVTSGYRACNKKLTQYFAQNYAQDYPEPEAIIASVINGFKVGEVPVKMKERLGGVSSISTFKSVYYMVKVTISLIVYKIGETHNKGEKDV